MVRLPKGEKKFDDMFSRFDRVPVCDEQTDGLSDGQTDILRPRLCRPSRGKN